MLLLSFTVRYDTSKVYPSMDVQPIYVNTIHIIYTSTHTGFYGPQFGPNLGSDFGHTDSPGT